MQMVGARINETTVRRHATAFPEEVRKPSAFEVLLWGNNNLR
jgi:hypothetical protein